MSDIDELKRLKQRFDKIKTEAAVVDDRFEEAKKKLEEEFEIKVDETNMEELEEEIAANIEEAAEELRTLIREIKESIRGYEDAE